jgi:hypothetical protein
MKCLRCQAENDAGARFCEDCGARLEAACPSCGTPVTPGKKFCRSCGAALTTVAARLATMAQPAAKVYRVGLLHVGLDRDGIGEGP